MLNRSITDMLREEIKWNHKMLTKTRERREREETKTVDSKRMEIDLGNKKNNTHKTKGVEKDISR